METFKSIDYYLVTSNFQEKLGIYNYKNYLYRKPTQVDK